MLVIYIAENPNVRCRGSSEAAKKLKRLFLVLLFRSLYQNAVTLSQSDPSVFVLRVIRSLGVYCSWSLRLPLLTATLVCLSARVYVRHGGFACYHRARMAAMIANAGVRALA